MATEHPLRILVVDDSPFDRRMVAQELARDFPGCQLVEAQEASDFRAALAADGFHLVVTDFQLHWGDGLGILRAVKERTPDCPVIMFTASGNQEIAVEAMKSGLDDYIVKSPQHLIRLAAAVRKALEQAAARRRAAELEGRLDALLNRLDVGVFRAAADGALRECNPALLRLLGAASLADAERLPLPELRQALRDTPAAPAPPRELPLRRPDGTPGWVLLSATWAAGAGGAETIEGIVEDITRRKTLEAELQRHAAAMAEAAARRDEFLAVMAHELRNPLAPIRNSLYILRQPNLPAATSGTALDVMDRQLRHLTRLIDDLLDITRITRGKVVLRREPVDLGAAVGEVVDAFRPRVAATALALTLTPAPGPLPVSADPARLTQILGNLLDNALKFTKTPGTIMLAAGAEGGDAVVRVRDTGVGIPPDKLEHIFEPFTHVGRSISGASQWGLGIGLFLVRKLAELHGGSVRAYSAGPGQGSEFVLRLPLSPPTN